MAKPFIPRSLRGQIQARKIFDSSNAKLQTINQSNKDFWEQKKAEEEARLNRLRRP